MKKRVLSIVLSAMMAASNLTLNIFAADMGNLNGDTAVDSADVNLLYRSVMGYTELTDEQKSLADVNCDDKINSADVNLLYRCVMGYAELKPAAASVLPMEKDAELKADLQNRIDEILDTDTEIVHSDTYIPGETYTGTAYYISADGDDNNDGLTPETAWQSMGKLLGQLSWDEEKVVKPGDAIFFRRGDIFRLDEWALSVTLDQITISAYGEGDKPIITASSENGSGEEKWNLIYEDESGKKIWQYYRDMRDVSMIVMNNGKVITDRVYEFWNGDGYVSCEAVDWWMHSDKGVELKDRLYSPEESLVEDMTIISRPVRYHSTDFNQSGPLYLRCDRGNPGELYESIEFCEFQTTGLIYLAEGADRIVLDNISFRCNGNSYIKTDIMTTYEWWDYENTVVQNCEFAYGGGSVTSYEVWEGGPVVVAQGDGVYTVVKNSTLRNNYFHDSICTTTTYEYDLSETRTSGGYYHVLDNVMVNTMGIRLDSTADSLKYLDSVIVRGNHIWNTGRMDRGMYIYSDGAFVLMPAGYGEYIIEDNVVYGTENGHPMNALMDVHFYDYEYFNQYTRPIMGNNIYVQYSGRNWGDFDMQMENTWSIDDPELLAKVEKYFGDTTSQFYVIQ